MAKDELASARDQENGAAVPVREPMKELKDWPAACHPDQPCKIDGVVYPAPAELDASDVMWWIDFTQTQVGASRNLLNGAMGAVLGAVLGSFVTVVGAAASGTPLLNALAGGGAACLVVAIAGWWLLRDSDHKPLEQRYLLYRQRARDLGVR